MTTRRQFLATASATALTAASYQRVLGANDKIHLGLIGSGGRGRSILGAAMKHGHPCVAMADVAPFRLEAGTAGVVAAKFEKPKTYSNHAALLDDKRVDAVMIATPDLHHHDHLLAAMAASKDTYIEKPLSKTLDEGKAMVAAVRAAKKIVQVGNQRHSGEHWKKCRDVIQSPDFGPLVWVKVWDCRNWVKKDPYEVPKTFTDEQAKAIDWATFQGRAPKRPFDAVRYFAWRWYWDYAGGLMTDIGAHQLDIVQWLSGVDAPKSVVANGGTYHFKHWETPDNIHGVWDYGSFSATFSVEFINGFDGVGAVFYGTKRTLVCNAVGEIQLFNTNDVPMKEQKPLDTWKAFNETNEHVKNWLDCVIAKVDPNSTIELGYKVVTAAHLANMAFRTGKKIMWDAVNEKVIG